MPKGEIRKHLLVLGVSDPHDIESAARLYLEYERKGLLNIDVAEAFAIAVNDFLAVNARAGELRKAN